MSWTQPCCDDCWVKREGAKIAHRVTAERFTDHQCAFCGRITHSGIFVRVDPATVRYPEGDK